jgi:hypothetical protein
VGGPLIFWSLLAATSATKKSANNTVLELTKPFACMGNELLNTIKISSFIDIYSPQTSQDPKKNSRYYSNCTKTVSPVLLTPKLRRYFCTELLHAK